MTLELRVPPVLVSAAFGLSMWLVAKALPALTVAVPWANPAAVGLGALGLGAALAGVLSFRKAKTTANPMDPSASSTIVTSGIYQWSRNPMYLGFLLVIAGWGVHLANVGALLGVPAFVVYMNRFQIMPEERALTAKFGAAYEAYLRRVRRWL